MRSRSPSCRTRSRPSTAEEAAEAIIRSLEILRELRAARGIATQSPVNLVLTDGSWMLATRYAFDYGWYPDDESFFASEREHDFTSLWYTTGGRFGRRPDGSIRDRRRRGHIGRRRLRAADQAHRRLARGARVLDAGAHAGRRRPPRRRHDGAGVSEEAASACRDAPLLAGIEPAEIERLEHFMSRFELEPGEHLFRQGDESSRLYLIESGHIDVEIDVGDGASRLVARLGPGESLGENSLLMAGPGAAPAPSPTGGRPDGSSTAPASRCSALAQPGARWS